MIQQFKGMLKAPLIQRRNERYEAILDEQVISYQDWIKRVEDCQDEMTPISNMEQQEKQPDTDGLQQRIKIVEYQECVENFDLSGVKEDYVVFAMNRDAIARGGLKSLYTAFEQQEQTLLLYGDEDEFNSNRTVRMNPWFKPDFSPDTLESCFYFGNLFAVRREAVKDIPLGNSKDYLENIYDFCLKVTNDKSADQIFHMKRVLYHAQNLQPLCISAEYDKIREQYRKSREKALELSQVKVSVIIPTKDQPEILSNCIASIVKWTKDISYEIIVVDNGSSPENKKKTESFQKKYGFIYLYQQLEFNFSKMCNLGAEAAAGNLLLFLNDDIEIRESKWLLLMAEKAAVKATGAVGAKLYYPESKIIQHAGITNLRLGPVHKLQFKEDVRGYYFERNRICCNVLAVTGACLMVRKEVFAAVKGFDENLAVAFNDVELCFRLYEAGFMNVVRNDIHLWHYESLSRGNDEKREKQERLKQERKKLYQLHPKLYAVDPFYHPCLSNDILDTGFSYACQYESGRSAESIAPVPFLKKLRQEWENECLMISLEYADSLEAWVDISDEKGTALYLQGYAFVAGADNSCFTRTLLLKQEETGILYGIPCNEIYRPDLEMNLDTVEKASLCGFSIAFEKEQLPPGTYQLGIYAKDCCSRQRLYRFTERYITI